MLITPGATGFLLTYRLPKMIGLALLFGNLSAVIGLYLSYHLNLASGAVMVLVATLFFGLAFLFSPSQGLLRPHCHTRSVPTVALGFKEMVEPG